MNPVHNLLCSSGWWERRVQKLLAFGLRDVELGAEVLEIGPGFGATTRRLAERVDRLTVLELEPSYCERLRRELGSRVEVVQGDATRLPFADGRFSAVLCFTMLHHIPAREQQDRVFVEAARVLAPGGTFAGTDSIGTGALFKLIHIGDTLLPIDPATMPDRLRSAGLAAPEVRRADGTFRFRAARATR